MYFLKKAMRLAFSLTVPVVAFIGFSLPAFAGSFTHVHSSKCYTEKTERCTHIQVYGREFARCYCPNCKRETERRTDGYMEYCPAKTCEPFYAGYVHLCDSCGYVFEDRSAPPPQEHDYKVTVLGCGRSEGSTSATVSASGGGGSWTSGPVSVSCSVSVSDPTFSVTGVSFSGGGGSTGTVTKNGTYSFTVNGSNGQSVSVPVTVSNIDTGAPKVTVSKGSNEWTNKAVSVSASASDDLSGVAGYSFNGGGYSSSSSWTVDSNGTYSVSVRDRAGNEASGSVTVSNIDRTAPTVSLSKSTDDWTEEGVTLSASASDDLSGIAGYSFGGSEYSSTSSWTVTSNGTYSVSVIDKAGNEASASVTVSKIGKDPVLEEQKRKKAEEEARKKAEEEARKKAEEEAKKKAEEEARKKAEEEARKKAEEATKPSFFNDNSGGDNGSDSNSENDNIIKNAAEKIETKAKETAEKIENKTKEKVNSIISKFAKKEAKTGREDIVKPAKSDSGSNEIPVNIIKNSDLPGDTPEATLVLNGMSTDPKGSADNVKPSFFAMLVSTPVRLLWLGLLFFFAAIVLMCTFTWVYEINGRKVKLICAAKVKEEKDRIIFNISGKRIKPAVKYSLFISPILKAIKSTKTIEIRVDGEAVSELSEDGKSFIMDM
jgi:hypothetical protein